jgi:hypothetical protein
MNVYTNKSIVITCVLLVFLLLGGCGLPSTEYTFEEGTLIDIQKDGKDLKFAFVDTNKKYHSNYEYSKEYEIVIDDSLTQPTVEYKVKVVTRNGDTDKQISIIDSNTEIHLLMNQKDYRTIFGESDVIIKDKPITP